MNIRMIASENTRNFWRVTSCCKRRSTCLTRTFNGWTHSSQPLLMMTSLRARREKEGRKLENRAYVRKFTSPWNSELVFSSSPRFAIPLLNQLNGSTIPVWMDASILVARQGIFSNICDVEKLSSKVFLCAMSSRCFGFPIWTTMQHQVISCILQYHEDVWWRVCINSQGNVRPFCRLEWHTWN